MNALQKHESMYKFFLRQNDLKYVDYKLATVLGQA